MVARLYDFAIDGGGTNCDANEGDSSVKAENLVPDSVKLGTLLCENIKIKRPRRRAGLGCLRPDGCEQGR